MQSFATTERRSERRSFERRSLKVCGDVGSCIATLDNLQKTMKFSTFLTIIFITNVLHLFGTNAKSNIKKKLKVLQKEVDGVINDVEILKASTKHHHCIAAITVFVMLAVEYKHSYST